MLFRYNAEKVVEEQKKSENKPIFEYDPEAELAKIKKFTENKQYLKEELPVYQPKVIKEKKIEVDNTDLSSWKVAAAQEGEVKKAKAEEARKEAEAKDKERVYNELRSKYNTVLAELDKTEDIFVKHGKLEALRNEVNATKYTEVKQKILPLLEPVYQKINESKGQKQAELETLKPQFEKDIKDMEDMQESSLSDELKVKYLEGFNKKWSDYAKAQKDQSLSKRFKVLYDKKILTSKNTGMILIYVGGGTFNRKGSNLTVSDFYIGKTEVTQEQYQSVMGKNPSKNRDAGDNYPVHDVTWYNAVEFCNSLSEMEGLTKCYSGSGNSITCNLLENGYRLPTEAEWEYAARGGNQSRGFEYSGSNSIDGVAWYLSNSGSKTHAVGTKDPNELGIYDMSGNVWEWCNDWDGDYNSSAQTNPVGPSTGSTRVLRGGSVATVIPHCRVTNSSSFAPDNSLDFNGFRIVRNVKKINFEVGP
jgi:hypothetical protein